MSQECRKYCGLILPKALQSSARKFKEHPSLSTREIVNWVFGSLSMIFRTFGQKQARQNKKQTNARWSVNEGKPIKHNLSVRKERWKQILEEILQWIYPHQVSLLRGSQYTFLWDSTLASMGRTSEWNFDLATSIGTSSWRGKVNLVRLWKINDPSW